MAVILHPAYSRPKQPMGEVRVKVTLTNGADEELHLRNEIRREQVRRYEAQALVDTGAIRSVVPAQVVAALGLTARGQRVVEYADGRKETVGITGPIIIDILGRDTLDEALILGD